MTTFLGLTIKKYSEIMSSIEMTMELLEHMAQFYRYTERLKAPTNDKDSRKEHMLTPDLAKEIKSTLIEYQLDTVFADQPLVIHLMKLDLTVDGKDEIPFYCEDWLRILSIAIFEKLMVIPYKYGRKSMEEVHLNTSNNKDMPLEVPNTIIMVKAGLPQFVQEYRHRTITKQQYLLQDLQNIMLVSHDVALHMPLLLLNLKHNLMQHEPKPDQKQKTDIDPGSGDLFADTPAEASQADTTPAPEKAAAEAEGKGKAEDQKKSKDEEEREKLEQTKSNIDILALNQSLWQLKHFSCEGIQQYHVQYEQRNLIRILEEYKRQFELATSPATLLVTLCNLISFIDECSSKALRERVHNSLLSHVNHFDAGHEAPTLNHLILLRHQSVHMLDRAATTLSAAEKLSKDQGATEQSKLNAFRSSIISLIEFWKNTPYCMDPSQKRPIANTAINRMIEDIGNGLNSLSELIPEQDESHNENSTLEGVFHAGLIMENLKVPDEDIWGAFAAELKEAYKDPLRCPKSAMKKRLAYDALAQALGECLSKLYDWSKVIKDRSKMPIQKFRMLHEFVEDWRDYRNLRTHHNSYNVSTFLDMLKSYREKKDEIKNQLDEMSDLLQEATTKKAYYAQLVQQKDQLTPFCQIL